MRLHQLKKLLHIKENNCKNEGRAHRMGEIFANYLLGKILISRTHKMFKN
jgi:hypothetical protein